MSLALEPLLCTNHFPPPPTYGAVVDVVATLFCIGPAPLRLHYMYTLRFTILWL